ncbi:MAG: GNAT family protein [Bacteroidetes bacterium]|nr:GNAT family protein [Bacteroidota bacterium]
MQLIGELIQLRALEPSDLDQLYKWENDTAIWSVSGTLAPFSRFVLEQYLASSHEDIYSNKQLRLIIDLTIHDDEGQVDNDSRPIGCIDLFDFDPKNRKAGVGILIADRADRGKGYATEALNLLVDYCFDILDLHQLFSNVRVDNENSVALFKKVGFEVTGLKQDWILYSGRWYDEYTMQLIKK